MTIPGWPNVSLESERESNTPFPYTVTAKVYGYAHYARIGWYIEVGDVMYEMMVGMNTPAEGPYCMRYERGERPGVDMTEEEFMMALIAYAGMEAT